MHLRTYVILNMFLVYLILLVHTTKLETSFLEYSDRSCREPVQVPRWIDHFMKAFELLKEAAKVDLAIVLPRTDRADAQLLLAGDNVGQGFMLSLEKCIGEDFNPDGLSLAFEGLLDGRARKSAYRGRKVA